MPAEPGALCLIYTLVARWSRAPKIAFLIQAHRARMSVFLFCFCFSFVFLGGWLATPSCGEVQIRLLLNQMRIQTGPAFSCQSAAGWFPCTNQGLGFPKHHYKYIGWFLCWPRVDGNHPVKLLSR